MDIFDILAEPPFDVIVANAVTYLFEPAEFEQVSASFTKALSPSGVYVGYELVFPGNRERPVIEKSEGHPEGWKLILARRTSCARRSWLRVSMMSTSSRSIFRSICPSLSRLEPTPIL